MEYEHTSDNEICTRADAEEEVSGWTHTEVISALQTAMAFINSNMRAAVHSRDSDCQKKDSRMVQKNIKDNFK